MQCAMICTKMYAKTAREEVKVCLRTDITINCVVVTVIEWVTICCFTLFIKELTMKAVKMFAAAALCLGIAIAPARACDGAKAKAACSKETKAACAKSESSSKASCCSKASSTKAADAKTTTTNADTKTASAEAAPKK